jgi:hypothetical protein
VQWQVRGPGLTVARGLRLASAGEAAQLAGNAREAFAAAPASPRLVAQAAWRVEAPAALYVSALLKAERGRIRSSEAGYSESPKEGVEAEIGHDDLGGCLACLGYRQAYVTCRCTL